jgi:hypothetical protein
MNVNAGDLLRAVAIGAGATFLMDLWNFSLTRLFGIPSLNYCVLGRWVLHMPKSGHGIVPSAPAGPGTTQEPGHAYRLRTGIVRLRLGFELPPPAP